MQQYPAATNEELAAQRAEWDRNGPPVFKPKTKLQIIAEDFCAGCAWQRSSDALWAVAAELQQPEPDYESCERIIRRSAYLLSQSA